MVKKLGKKQKIELLKDKFPEFYKYSIDLENCLDALHDMVWDKLNKIEELQEDIEDLRDRKLELEQENI